MIDKQETQYVEQVDSERISFAGMYFMAIGFLWQLLWQLNKLTDIGSQFILSKQKLDWIATGTVSLIFTYLIGYMVYLETKKGIDSKGILIKYIIGLVFGYILARILFLR